LDGKPEADNGVAGCLDQHAHAIGRPHPGKNQRNKDCKAGKQHKFTTSQPVHTTTLSLKMPVGRQISTAIRMKNGTTILYSVGTKAMRFGISMKSGRIGFNGRNSTDQLKMAKVSVKPTSMPPAIAP